MATTVPLGPTETEPRFVGVEYNHTSTSDDDLNPPTFNLMRSPVRSRRFPSESSGVTFPDFAMLEIDARTGPDEITNWLFSRVIFGLEETPAIVRAVSPGATWAMTGASDNAEFFCRATATDVVVVLPVG